MDVTENEDGTLIQLGPGELANVFETYLQQIEAEEHVGTRDNLKESMKALLFDTSPVLIAALRQVDAEEELGIGRPEAEI